jgi:signal transduction histidine kinase
LLNNVLKHAHATEATVNITGYEHYLDLTVEDNGVGFIKKTMQHNMGLSTISHRVQALAGAFTIDSSPGNGTTINIEIPLI